MSLSDRQTHFSEYQISSVLNNAINNLDSYSVYLLVVWLLNYELEWMWKETVMD
jgi:hypothetical protein